MSSAIVVIIVTMLFFIGWGLFVQYKVMDRRSEDLENHVFVPGIVAYLAVIGHAFAGLIFCSLNLFLPKTDALSWGVFGGFGIIFFIFALRTLRRVRGSSIVVESDSLVLCKSRKHERIYTSCIKEVVVAYGTIVIVRHDGKRNVIPLYYRDSNKLIELVRLRRTEK